MSLFQPATSSSAFLKMGIMGKQGAGKSFTAGMTAIGLVQYAKERGADYANKPVAFFDTETGSDWLIPVFKKAGVPLFVAKKKSFAALLEAVKWAEQNASALIIDSITHPWRELLESYMAKKQRTFLQIDDWGYLKGDHGWAQFTDLYINSNLHIIMCGRAGDDTEQYTDENGKRQFEKVGVKMKTEGETGFEPSLLVLMEREMNLRTNQVVHKATVLKDRSDTLDGEEFEDPGFEQFLPHIKLLNLGGAHVGVDTRGDSQHILTTEKRDWSPVQRRICIDEIQTLLSLHHPGSTAVEKTAKLKLVLKHFNTVWTEIEEVMPLPDLRAGYDSLHQELEGKPSKYGTIVKAEGASIELNDSLPDHSSKEGAAAQAKPDQTLEQKLIADLPEIKTVPGLLAWAVEVTNKHRAALGEDAFNRVNVAMMARQTEILKTQSQEPSKEGGEPAEPSKDGPKLAPDLAAIDPKTGAPGFLTREPKPEKATRGKARAEQPVEFYENA